LKSQIQRQNGPGEVYLLHWEGRGTIEGDKTERRLIQDADVRRVGNLKYGKGEGQPVRLGKGGGCRKGFWWEEMGRATEKGGGGGKPNSGKRGQTSV